MNYTFLPSLEHIVLVKIATGLWNQSDIRALIVKFDFEEDSIILKNIEEKIKEKILLLHTPSSLKEKILCAIKPIGLEIYRWIECNKKSYNLAVNLPNEFSWTPHGTIDRKKTAKALMTDETIDITERYKLACIYCLEKYVRALWEKMPETHRASFYNEDDPSQVEQHELVLIWPYYIKGELANIQFYFICAFIHCNKVAAEYFWSKLTLEDREDSLTFIVNNWVTDSFNFFRRNSDGFDILRFLFSLVNKDQQIALFEKYSWEVLQCFLQWPWQSLFKDVTNHVVLTNLDYYSILITIVKKVTEGYKDYDYQRLFGEFWQKSTEDHKRFIVNRLCKGDYMLYSLFRNKDMKNISLILKDASVLEKEAIYKRIGFDIFFNLYYAKKFDMIEFFINEFISSYEMMIEFKGKCKEFLWHDDRLEKFLDDLIQKFNLK